MIENDALNAYVAATIEFLRSLGYGVSEPDPAVERMQQVLYLDSERLEGSFADLRALVMEDQAAYEQAFETLDFDRMFSVWTAEGLLKRKRQPGSWNLAPRLHYNDDLDAALTRAVEPMLPQRAGTLGRGMQPHGSQ